MSAKRPLLHKFVRAILPSHANELVAHGRNELTHKHGDTVLNGGIVLRLPRSDRGVKRGPRKGDNKTVKPSKSTGKRVGRPPVYNGMDRIIMRGALKSHGLTGAQRYLAKERNLDVSITVLRSVAKQFGLMFQRGRPAAA